MKPKPITEESNRELIESWFVEANKCANVGQLKDFVGHLITDYNHDYGTIIHAMTAAAIAAIHTMESSPQGGITGFQASCLFWEFTRRWGVFSEGPKQMVIYENMLYPQYCDKFDTTITPEIWEWLQKKAKERLSEKSDIPAHIDVMNHWKSIADGVVPFGYSVKEER